MGIIEKQATRNVVYSYLGVALGFVTVMGFSHILKPDENGLTRILISLSALFSQFASLGFNTVTVKLFPFFRDKDKQHHGYLFYGIMTTLAGFAVFCVLFFFFKESIIESNQEKSRLFADHLYYLLPLTFFSLFFNLFDNYLRACYISVIGSSSKDFTQRVLILFSLFLYFIKIISFSTFVLFYVIATCIPTLILLYYIIKFDQWHIRPVRGFISAELRKEMIQLCIFSILSGSAGVLISNIDLIMVNQKLGLSETGIYGIAFYFGTIISIPARSLYRITSGIVSESFKTGDLRKINELYAKSCNSQLAIGLLLFIGVWANIDNIMQLLPAEYESGRYVILFISAGNLLDMGTGINGIILLTSRFYKYDALFMLFVVIITILTNYLLIPVYGITGSAIATAITIGSYNLLRWLALFIKFGMQPYDFNIIKLILIALLAFLPGYYIPLLNNLYIDITIRSSVICLLFILLMLKTEASPELNNKIRKNLHHLRIK
ncbi:MAG TPA: oligosaccharide flippase family protein [Bacteroidia bacterium]|nr:oligosaccharide flippase family protein [Bacteroidia bacterium]